MTGDIWRLSLVDDLHGSAPATVHGLLYRRAKMLGGKSRASLDGADHIVFQFIKMTDGAE
jgi:hypothetical protein